MILISLLISIGLLLLTKGLYVEWGEFVIVVIASCTISLFIRQVFIKHIRFPHSYVALTAFFLFWGFSLFDLIGDHFMYYLPKEGVFYDGRPLTLDEKINEFNDDLVAVSWFPPLIMLVLLFIFPKLSQAKTKRG